MSYIPDYRTKANYDALNADDKAFLDGYHAAVRELMSHLTDKIDSFEDFDMIEVELLDRLEGRFSEEEQRKILEAILGEVATVACINEREMWCGIVESADYIPENWEPEDLDGGPYVREDNKKRSGEPMYSDEDYGIEEEGAE